MQRQKGFTIIELIVVIAIIAILAAVVLVRVSKYIQDSKVVAAKADMKQLQTLSVLWLNNKQPESFVGFCGDSDYGGKIYPNMRSRGFLSPGDVNFQFWSYGGGGTMCKDNGDSCNGKWYALLSNSGDNTYYCVDSAGGTSTTSGNSSNCSCN